MGGHDSGGAGGEKYEQTPHDPARLGFACLLNGVEPVDPARPFAWLGIGADEQDLARLAARFPHGGFHRLDADGVPDAALPELDFVTLPDTWAVLDPGRRAAVVDLLAHRLKPGAVVLAAYDAMPGATVQEPLQRLFVEYRNQHPSDPEQACAWIQDLVDADADFLAPGSAAHRQWIRYREGGARLAGTALYAADVGRELAAAKLAFAGSADLSRIFTEDFMTAEQEAVLAGAANPELRETLRDFLCNTAWRCDLFVRGPRALLPARAMQWFARCLLAAAGIGIEARVQAGAALPLQTLADALAQGPRTLAELLELPAFRGKPRLLQRAAACLVAQAGAAVSFLPACAMSAEEAR